MYLVITEEQDRLVSVPDSFLGVLRPFDLNNFHRDSFLFCCSRDRWDKELFILQAG